MHISTFLAAALVLAPSSGMATEPPQRVMKVKVDGAPYKVTINGTVAKAKGTAVFIDTGSSTYFPRAKRAIEQATGCIAKDTFTSGIKLIATLDCERQSAPSSH